jgi:hypothetical protein
MGHIGVKYFMNDIEEQCEDRKWMHLFQNHVQWRILILAALNRWVFLPGREGALFT